MTDTTFETFGGGAADPANPAPAKSSTRPRYAVWSRTFGVFFPAFVLLLEVVTGFCAEHFFDPVSTGWHVLLVACVPAATFFATRALITGKSARPRLLGAAIGFALAVAAYYTVLYLPLMPASMVALMAMGLGLLSLAPFLNFLALTSVAWRLWERRDLGAGAGRLVVGGFLLGTLALAVVEGPRYIARFAITLATAEDSGTQDRGLALLRAVGSKDTVLRACYEPRDNWMIGGADSAGWLSSFLIARSDPDEARQVYYRMTGESFNSVPAPEVRSRFMEDGWGRTVVDDDRGGALVGGRVPELSLESSRIDCHLDAASSLSYTEWALVFDNRADVAAEARFGVAFPAGAVSRLTLWINGEPHEAAFGTKSQTRGAYESVVRRQLDPVLVTQNAPGRVLVQCFPVPARDTMKIRFGITAPLDAAGRCWLPSMAEHNFEIRDGLRHDVWAQSAAPELATGLGNLHAAVPRGGGHGLEGEVDTAALAGGTAWVSAGGGGAAATVHALDQLGDKREPRVLVRRANTTMHVPPERVVVVADTSIAMREHWAGVEDAIELLAQQGEVTLVLATDAVEVAEGAAEAAAALARTRPVGGIDNSPALLRALALAGADEDTPVLWLHGPQPELLEQESRIEQALERRLVRRPIYSLQLEPGADRVGEVFAAYADLRPAPRGESMGEQVALLLGGGERVSYRYEQLPAGSPAPEGSVEVWDHLVRSWALDEVTTAIRGGKDGSDPLDLAHRAARYQLVTPLSGAVVLERQSQFEAAGLDQLSATDTPSVPVIPEPSTGALTILAAAMFALRRRR